MAISQVGNLTQFRLGGIHACVFDAYGTLFDVNSAAAQAKDALGERWQSFADTWLRGLMGRHAEFCQVTGEALDFAMTSFGINDSALRERLMELYLRLAAYPEVKPTLVRLKSAGMKLAILSNGSPDMLSAAVDNSSIWELLDAVLSVGRWAKIALYQFCSAEGGSPRHLQQRRLKIPNHLWIDTYLQ